MKDISGFCDVIWMGMFGRFWFVIIHIIDFHNSSIIKSLIKTTNIFHASGIGCIFAESVAEVIIFTN